MRRCVQPQRGGDRGRGAVLLQASGSHVKVQGFMCTYACLKGGLHMYAAVR